MSARKVQKRLASSAPILDKRVKIDHSLLVDTISTPTLSLGPFHSLQDLLQDWTLVDLLRTCSRLYRGSYPGVKLKHQEYPISIFRSNKIIPILQCLRIVGDEELLLYLRFPRPLFKSITSVSLISISHQSFAHFSTLLGVNCTILSLYICFVDVVGLSTLVEALRTNTTLKILNLCGNLLRDEDTDSLGELLKSNRSITDLKLSGNSITGENIDSFREGLANNDALLYLNLENNSLSDAGVGVICNALTINRSVTSVNLSGDNDFSDQGISFLARALRINKSIKSLHLGRWDGIGIENFVVHDFAEMLKINTTLESL